MTLCQLYAKQNAQRGNVKKSTQKQREQLMEILKADKLGARSIDSIKPSDAKEWAVRMKENGYAYQTINIRLISMSEETCQRLQKVVAERKNIQPIVIDGYSDFVFLNQKGYPMTGAYYTSTF